MPASLASSSLAMPLSLFVFLAVCFLPNCWSALNLDQAKTDSTIPDLSNFLVNRSLNVHLDPNLLIWRVIISFVWESKVGLTTRQLTNNHKWFLIYKFWNEKEHIIYSFEDNLEVIFWSNSFVWESKVGLTTRQLTNNQKWFLIYKFWNEKEHIYSN